MRTLSSSASVGSGTGGAVRVVISPKGGHGKDAVKELGGHFVITNTTLAQAEGDDLTVANDFRQVGIVVDPFNYGTTTVASSDTARLTYVVKMSSSSGTFDVDEEITQATTGAVGRVVEWDSSRSLLYYSQERFSTYGTGPQQHNLIQRLVEQTPLQVLLQVQQEHHLQLQVKQSHLQVGIQSHLQVDMLTQSCNQIVVI